MFLKLPPVERISTKRSGVYYVLVYYHTDRTARLYAPTKRDAHRLARQALADPAVYSALVTYVTDVFRRKRS